MRTARGFQSPQFPKTPKFSGYSQKKTRYRTNHQVLHKKGQITKSCKTQMYEICAGGSRGKQQGIRRTGTEAPLYQWHALENTASHVKKQAKHTQFMESTVRPWRHWSCSGCENNQLKLSSTKENCWARIEQDRKSRAKGREGPDESKE